MILVVEDDAVFRERLARALRDRAHAVVTAGDLGQAMAAAEQHAVTHAIIDLRLPGASGLEVLQQLGNARPELRAIILSGSADEATEKEARRLGAVACVRKPTDLDELLGLLMPPQTQPR
jgi:two-component system, response regulator RegA